VEEKSYVEAEVAHNKNQVDEVENELFLKPLFFEVEFKQLNLVLKVVLHCFQQ
jgi:hypothetical protein